MTTPGYKARVAFPALALSPGSTAQTESAEIVRFSDGSMRATGNPLDLAIEGDGFFVVATKQGQLLYTRQGHFQRAADGRIVTAGGNALQQAGGGDLVVEAGQPEIAADGTLLADGRPVARIAVARAQVQAQLAPVSGSGLPWKNWSNSEESPAGHENWRNLWDVSVLHRSRSSRSCVKWM